MTSQIAAHDQIAFVFAWDSGEVKYTAFFSGQIPDIGIQGSCKMPESAGKLWKDATAVGEPRSICQMEWKVLWGYSSPQTVTTVLQYFPTASSIFTTGHLGRLELSAVSLASMTANITGYAI
jgi:hypothetical protein